MKINISNLQTGHDQIMEGGSTSTLLSFSIDNKKKMTNFTNLIILYLIS